MTQALECKLSVQIDDKRVHQKRVTTCDNDIVHIN